MRSSTKVEKSGRGRPRQFERDEALAAATRTFHQRGFAGSSLDELAAAMGINRPSLYNAFGNKESLYREALARFIADLRDEMSMRLAAPTLAEALAAFYGAALDVYLASDTARGCFVFCTAPAEAMTHPAVRAVMAETLVEIDGALTARFELAQQAGEYPARADCASAAKLAQAVLHSLALRARAGESRRTLNRFVKDAVRTLCAGC